MANLHELPDGARMAYDDAGSGRPVVLIHGVSMSRRFFERNVAERIPGELVLFERSGHCPMWEEPDRWNQVVGDWISAL
jgi:pimeloyl-ACP methyl ester carboxylesterase